VHAQQIREKALLKDWWRTLGWQKSSTPTLNSSTKSLVRSSSSCLALMCMAPPKHTQAKVGCAGLLHAAVCSSAPQCLEPFPPAPIVRIAPQDHRVHLLGATWHACARSEQKHRSAQVRYVCPLCAVASRSAARAIPLLNLGHQRNATLTNGGKTALTSALLRAAKRASTGDAGLKDGCMHVSSVLGSAVSQVRPHFLRFAKTLHFLILTVCICVCVCMEREKER